MSNRHTYKIKRKTKAKYVLLEKARLSEMRKKSKNSPHKFLKSINNFYDSQYGFREKQSTTDCLFAACQTFRTNYLCVF